MSSTTTSTTASSGQQTLYDAAAPCLIRKFPTGIILRYEQGNNKLEEFILGNTLITYVMFNVSDAREIIEEHGSLHAYLSAWQIPIVTATEYDEDLQNRQRDDIRYVLERIQPAIYIPDAGKVYLNDLEYKQRGGLHEYKIRVNWLIGEIERRDWGIQLLPLAKGMERWQLKELLPFFQKHEFTNFAVYTRQYCNNGNRINDLLDHMHNLIDIVDPDNIFAIARHGKSHLEKFPPRVNGASGLKQFLTHCNYQEEKFKDWRSNLKTNALNRNRDFKEF